MSDESNQAELQNQLDTLDDMFKLGRLPKERYETIRKNLLARFATEAGQPSKTAPVTEEDYAALRDAARRPALLLDKMPRPDMAGAPGCWLGGLPTLPSDIAWPWFTYFGKPVAPMHFVAQIDLAQLPDLDGLPERPALGTLFFFATPLLSQLLDGEGRGPNGHVIHVAGDVSGLPPRPMPGFPYFADFPNIGEDWALHYQEMRTTALDRWNIGFRAFDSLGGITDPRDEVRRRRDTEQVEIMQALEEDAAARLAGATRMGDGMAALHHMFGHGTTGSWGFQPDLHSTDPKAPRSQLLVLDNDADIGYFDYLARWTTFWIVTDDLADGRFQRVEVQVEGA